MAQKKVLQGYKKVKTRFVPPLMQIPNIRESSYVDDLLPHVVWMALLVEALGTREGIRRSFEIAKLAHKIHTSEEHVNFAICGSYAKLTTDEVLSLVASLERQGSLELYREALSPLVALHPSCPMRAFGLPDTVKPLESLLARLRTAVGANLDRYGNAASIMQANVMVIRAATGGLFFSEGIDIPDFDTLIHSPDSDAAQRAASFARNGAMQELMSEGEHVLTEWPKAFWNANYRLDACLKDEVADE